MSPFNNMNMQNVQGLLNQFQGFMKNPAGAIMQSRLGIPQEYMNNPDKAIQYLMDTGKINQVQYNQAQQYMRQITK